MMPILHFPGEMMPGQFGPISRVFEFFSAAATRTMSSVGMPFRNADDERQLRIHRFQNRVGRKWRRHEYYGYIRARLAHRAANRVEHRHAEMLRPAFGRRDAAHNLRAVLDHLLCVKAALAPGKALHEQSRVVINQDAHERAAQDAKET